MQWKLDNLELRASMRAVVLLGSIFLLLSWENALICAFIAPVRSRLPYVRVAMHVQAGTSSSGQVEGSSATLQSSRGTWHGEIARRTIVLRDWMANWPRALVSVLLFALGAPLRTFAGAGEGFMPSEGQVVRRAPVVLRVLKKVLKGASNSVGVSAGDSGSAMKSLLNTAGQLTTLAGLFCLCFFIQKKRELDETQALERELLKMKEYKENMYFDAVEEILEKLKEPTLKGSQKAYLNKQLRDLDPEGKIAVFVTEGGQRPDLSGIPGFDERPKRKREVRGGKGKRPPMKKSERKEVRSRGPKSTKDAPPLASPKKTPKKNSWTYDDDQGEDDEADEDAEAGFFEDLKAPKPTPSRRPAPPQQDDTPERKLYRALYESLEDVLEKPRRQKLVRYIQGRMEGLAAAKKESTLTKIASKIGDDRYWMDYAERVL